MIKQLLKKKTFCFVADSHDFQLKVKIINNVFPTQTLIILNIQHTHAVENWYLLWHCYSEFSLWRENVQIKPILTCNIEFFAMVYQFCLDEVRVALNL